MPQYSAKLLFQFRTIHNGLTPRRRLCEERIVSLKAANAKAALAKVKKLGRSGNHDYRSVAGGHVYFEFLGVIELIEMSTYADQVWYELVERFDPERRLKTLLKPERELHALDIERRRRRHRARRK